METPAATHRGYQLGPPLLSVGEEITAVGHEPHDMSLTPVKDWR